MDLKSGVGLLVVGLQNAWSEYAGTYPMVGFDVLSEGIGDLISSAHSGYYAEYYGSVIFVNLFDEDLLTIDSEEYTYCEYSADSVLDLFEDGMATSFCVPMLNPSFDEDSLSEDIDDCETFPEWLCNSSLTDMHICGINVDIYGRKIAEKLLEAGIAPSLLVNHVSWTDPSRFVDTLNFFDLHGTLDRA